MVLWDLEGFLDIEGGFDDCGYEAAVYVPFNVAVEEPDTWIIGLEPEDKVAVRINGQGVSSHGIFWKLSCIGGVVGAGVWVGTRYNLESMTVKMERVFPAIFAVKDKFDDIVFLEDECVGAAAVDGDVVCGLTSRHEGVEGGNLWTDICCVVEERT